MTRSFRHLGLFPSFQGFSMRRAVRDIVAALNRGEGERCRRQTRKGVFPINEVWIESLGFWVPWDGRTINATLRGYGYPNAVHRARIKRAVERWRNLNGC